MHNDFSKPQRQSMAGIVIMSAHTLQQFLRAMIIPLAIFVIKAQTNVLTYAIIGVVAISIIILFFSYLSYLKFTFYLDHEKQEFIINKGIFSRTLLTIRLDKIQQVNINQSLLQKLIGVYSLQIDTPGGDSNEVSIKAINEKLAYSLKEHLLNGQKDSTIVVTPTLSQVPFLKLSATTLFKVGLTSNYGSSLLLLMGFIYAVFHNAKDLLKAFDTDNGQVEAAIKTGASLFSVGILIAIFLGILLLINIVRTFVTYFDFNISKHKFSLLLSSGLFAKKNMVLSPMKIQTTTYSQNYFQKKLNLINFSLKQAASGEPQHDTSNPHKSVIHIPGCSSIEKDELLVMILGKIPKKGASFAPNYRFLNLPILFLAILPLCIFSIFWFHFEEVKPYYPLSFVYFIMVSILTYISYKNHRLTVNKEFIIKKSGIWDVSHEIIFPHKIQAITTYQYPWHKKADVGHVNIHTAGGVIHFMYGNYTEIKRLVNYWLYQIESGSEEWM
jgi:putative membrane protein